MEVIKIKLNQGERSIMAYFPSSSKAQKAVDELKDMGINTAQIDRISRYGTTFNQHLNNPISGQAITQTGLTISSDSTASDSDAARVLMSADPSVSGMANKGYGIAGGKNFLVTVVTDEKHLNRVVKILEKNDGMV